MKQIFKWPRPQPAVSRQDYLDKLGKLLLWRLPVLQVREILSDYRERFEAGRELGKTDAELIQALGSPQEAAAQILEETPASGLLRYYLPRGALLALCLVFFWFFVFNPYPEAIALPSGCLFLPMIAGVLFSLLRGGARIELEKQFPPERTVSRKALFGVPLAIAVLFKAGHQLWISAILRDPAGMTYAAPMSLGVLNQLVCLGLAGIMALLALWWLVRCAARSVRYFPGVIHALGLSVAALTTLLPFLSRSVFIPTLRSLSLTLLLFFLPYLAGLGTAMVFQRWLDAGLPAWSREPLNVRQDYLDKLGKHLVRWFPVGQVREILADYQEQFELALERGKSEAALAGELGRPEEAARDLLATESPLLRRRVRRRDILWGIVLAPSVWVLAGMFLQFEYGHQWLYGPDLAPLFLVTGSAALFALLRGMGRAEVEGQFPPERGGPPVWAYLLPLADMVLTAAGFWYILKYGPWSADGHMTVTAAVSICFIELSVLLLDVLLVWTLSGSAARSIWYFPAAVLAVGAAMSCLKAGQTLQSFNPEWSFSGREFTGYLLEVLFPYLTAVVTAAGFAVVMRICARRGKAG